MAINVNLAFAGQGVRSASVGESLNKARGGPERVSPPASETELANASAPRIEAPASDPQAPAKVEPPSLDKAIEAANAIAESNLRATNRSVTFSKDDRSGRIQITIREKGVNGEEVLRQIPPSSFFKMVERLSSLNENGEAHRGALLDIES